MIKKISIGILAITMASSCVSKKIYADLENKYTDLKKENRTLADANADLSLDKNHLETTKDSLTSEMGKLKSEREKLLADQAALNSKMNLLQESYKALEKNSSDALQANMNKNRDLLAELDAKAKALSIEQERLSKSTQRLDELESLVAAKEAAMKKLKETLSSALNSFEGKGLTVEQKNGKVYVSMENKLLFNSGSWSVGPEGKKQSLK